MPDTLIAQIRHHLQQLAAGDLSAGQLESWLTGASWNVLKWGDAESIRLVGDVGLTLSEFEHGDLSEKELCEWARTFAVSDVV